MAGSEGRELNVLAGKLPYRRPIIGECDLGLVRAEPARWHQVVSSTASSSGIVEST